MRKVTPFLKAEYFTESTDRLVYHLIQAFITKYNKPPTIEALEISLQDSSITESDFKEAQTLIQDLSLFELPNHEWLITETEKFCKDKAVYNAILRSIGVLE